MKRETKRVIPLIALLLIIDAFFCGFIFYYQSEIIDGDYKDIRQKQINTLADLSTEALAGGDFAFLNTLISRINQQGDIVRAFVVEDREHKILLSTRHDDYGKVFVENDFFGSSSQVIPLRASLSISGKQWATLTILFDKASGSEKKNRLLMSLIPSGVIIFLLVSLLIFGAGKLASRSYKHMLSSSIQSTDIFTLPELYHNTIIAVNKSRDKTLLPEDELSQQQQRILKIIFPHKTVHDILLESPFDEPVTFELISSLVAYEKAVIVRDKEKR
jgi:hypothetical protein